jgi:hypothetical protein
MVSTRRNRSTAPEAEVESEAESSIQAQSNARSKRSIKNNHEDSLENLTEVRSKRKPAAAAASSDDDDAPEVVHSSSMATQQLRELHESRALPVEKKRKIRKGAKPAATVPEALDMDVLEAAASTDFSAIQAAAVAAAQKKSVAQEADAAAAESLRIDEGPRKKTKVMDNIHITFLPEDNDAMLVYRVPKSASEFLKASIESAPRRMKYSSYRSQKKGAVPAASFGRKRR